MKDNVNFYLNSSGTIYSSESCSNHNFQQRNSETKKKKELKFLNNWWKSLITCPHNFAHSPNSTISSILEEDITKLASDSIKDVLIEKFALSFNSAFLSKAIEDSFQIYHEDFPYDFILAHQGERLGMMILDKCSNLNGEANLIYRFNPEIKSFRGLF